MPPDPASEDIRRLIARGVRDGRMAIGWSQRRLSRQSGVAQSQISRIERAILPGVRLSTVDRLFRALGIRYFLTLDPPHVEPRRQLDLVHARCSAHVERRLRAAGWLVARETEIGDGRSRGWIDLLAYDPAARTLLVIEIKTELVDAGAIERAMNWYEREAWTSARRLGWRPRRVAGTLLVLMSNANDRFLSANRALVDTSFPERARTLRSVVGRVLPTAGRSLAMIDPRSRATTWIRPARIDGRRTPAPYVDYVDAVRILEATTRRPVRRPTIHPGIVRGNRERGQ